ncbi:MAG: penicillin-binding protein 2 [Patescibacteria group bacterium]
MVLRFGALIALPLSIYAFLIFHLYQIQIVKGDYYLARAESQTFSPNFIKANRGVIYFTDKNGNTLSAAINKNFPVIYAVPKAIEDSLEAANLISPIVGRSVEELEAMFSKPDDTYELIVRKAGSDSAKKVEDLNVNGIYVIVEPTRFYPLGPVASQMLGFVGPSSDEKNETGHYGLEEFYENKVAGEAGSIVDGEIKEPTPGEDLSLTIDPNIQTEAENVLKKLVDDYKAKGGSVIVEDPLTGKILAMGSLPGFDPNNYGNYPLQDFINPATQQVYEPGSVFKVITMSAGIDSGKITPDTVYFDKGTVTLNGRTISNYDLATNGPYGRATMTNVLEHSINTGAVFAEREMGRDIFTDYVKKFGFGEKTGIDLPAEVKGDLGRLSPKEKDIAFATASYGQGVAATPLEVINAFSAIANGGKLMRPHLNASMEPTVARRVIGEETARRVTEMMVSAVDKAKIAKINGYSLAGKTGTAFVPDFKNGGYTDNVINTYVGFGPTTDPRFVILLKLNEPEGAPVAGLSVVPAFRDLAQFIINYYGIQPDRLDNKN